MESIKELKIKCQSQKRNKNFLLAFGYTFHRNLSIYITKFLLIVFPKVSPNSISIMMILVSLVGCFLLISQNLWLQLLGIGLVYLGFLLDKVDGEVARYKKMFSLRGTYLDELYHILVPAVLFFCFFLNLVKDNFYFTTILFILIFFYLLNRYNRKISLIIYVKNLSNIKNNNLQYYEKNKVAYNLFDNYIFKIFSIIERFDLIILTMFLAIAIDLSIYNAKLYLLYIYAVFSFVYFLRWLFLNYFGNLEEMINKLEDRGY